MTVIMVFYFIQILVQIFVKRLRYIVSAVIYYLVHYWCTVFGETVCISYSIICDILFDGAATFTRVERDRAYVRPWHHATIICDPDREFGICILT